MYFSDSTCLRRMSVALSLQVKKFINSEHTGDYAHIALPLELPELRMRKVRKASVAFDKALNAADESAEIADASDDNMSEPPDSQEYEKAQELEEKNGYEQVKMHYMEAGNGEPLILVHTVGQSLYTWRNVFERLSQSYRVIAVDLFGHGYSDRPDSFDYSIEDHARSLRLFMDALGIQSAHFIGFSLGAAYVLELARKTPERVGRVILLAPGGITPEMPLHIRMIDSSLVGGIASRLYSYKTVGNLLREAVFDLTIITEEVVEEYYRPASEPRARRAVRLSLHRFDDEELLKEMRNIDNEVLILWGSEDKWHLPESAQLFHAALHNAQFAVIRNAGHLLHEEKAEKLASAVLEYIPVIMP